MFGDLKLPSTRIGPRSASTLGFFDCALNLRSRRSLMKSTLPSPKIFSVSVSITRVRGVILPFSAVMSATMQRSGVLVSPPRSSGTARARSRLVSTTESALASPPSLKSAISPVLVASIEAIELPVETKRARPPTLPLEPFGGFILGRTSLIWMSRAVTSPVVRIALPRASSTIVETI